MATERDGSVSDGRIRVHGAHVSYFTGKLEASWQRGDERFDVSIQGARYRRVPCSRYRVWCLEQLRKRFADLPETAAAQARELLQKNRCWDPLWRPEEIASGHDPDGRAPFSPGLEVLTARGARARRGLSEAASVDVVTCMRAPSALRGAARQPESTKLFGSMPRETRPISA